MPIHGTFPAKVMAMNPTRVQNQYRRLDDLLDKDFKEDRKDTDSGIDDQAILYASTRTSLSYGSHDTKTAPFPQANAKTRSEISTPLSEDDFVRCLESLKASLSTCSSVEFVILGVMMSVVLNGFRHLDRYELYGLITLSLVRVSVVDGNVVDLVEMVFEKVELVSAAGSGSQARLFVEHPDGSLDFEDECMGRFLSSYRIRGLDLTHRVMAYACVQQLEMDSNISHPLFCALGSECLHFTSAFSRYAQQFWISHYQLSEISCPLLSERVHRLLYTWSCHSVTVHDECTWQAPCQRIADVALAYCTANHLHTLATFYTRVIASANIRQHCAIQAESVTDFSNSGLEAAMSQLNLAGTQNCIRNHQSRSSSPGTVASSTQESWFEEQRWILV